MFPLSHKPNHLFHRRQISIRSMVEQIFSKLFGLRYHCWTHRWVNGCTTSVSVCQHSPVTVRGIKMTQIILFVMHLSIASPTAPLQGWVGITGDLTMYFCQIAHSWGSSNPLNRMKNAHCVKIYRSQIPHSMGIN